VSVEIRAGHRTVEIPRAGKALFPSGITKADLANYYRKVADAMLPHIAGRPLNLERYPDGIDGERIIQQHASKHFPSWVRLAEVPARKGTVKHVQARDAATLVYLAGQACITFHRWLSRTDRLDRPDQLVVDLDPSNGTTADVRRAARIIGELFSELGLVPWLMSTGSRGYHVVVALQRRADSDTVREFSRDLSRLAAARESRLFTTEQRKAKREGKILLDVMRNAYGHTSVAPYSVRPRANAPVATPLRWDELDDPDARPDLWTLASIPERLERRGDPWRQMQRQAQTLATARRQLDRALREV
jgi:bifunctional non-homologous end joining protein LigD